MLDGLNQGEEFFDQFFDCIQSIPKRSIIWYYVYKTWVSYINKHFSPNRYKKSRQGWGGGVALNGLFSPWVVQLFEIAWSDQLIIMVKTLKCYVRPINHVCVYSQLQVSRNQLQKMGAHHNNLGILLNCRYYHLIPFFGLNTL